MSPYFTYFWGKTNIILSFYENTNLISVIIFCEKEKKITIKEKYV